MLNRSLGFNFVNLHLLRRISFLCMVAVFLSCQSASVSGQSFEDVRKEVRTEIMWMGNLDTLKAYPSSRHLKQELRSISRVPMTIKWIDKSSYGIPIRASKDQIVALTKIHDRYWKNFQDLRPEFKQVSDILEERRLRAAAAEEVNEILTEEQWEELEAKWIRLFIFRYGLDDVLTEGPFSEALNVTDEQRKAIAKEQKKLKQELDDWLEEMRAVYIHAHLKHLNNKQAEIVRKILNNENAAKQLPLDILRLQEILNEEK